MKVTTLIPLAFTATALVLPEPDIFNQIAIQDTKHHNCLDSVKAKLPTKQELKHELEDTLKSLAQSSKNALDTAFDWVTGGIHAVADGFEEEYFSAKDWFATAQSKLDEPHHPPPHHDDPHHGRPPHHGPPHHRKPHHKPNYTVYELINHSKYTTKLAALINKDADLVALLNGTTANFTIFAPIDSAFEKIPDHHKEPSKELIKKILTYHVSGEFYPAGRVLVSRTVPTLLAGEYLSSDPKDTPQRLSTNIGLRGLTVNFYSRIVAIDIFGSNGVIHGIDSLLIPPPSAARIITLLPSEFSTLELGLRKTELFDGINSTDHLGGTLFAPSNWAFTKLGPRINAFLFSEYGRKYLKALLEYHVVANQTLYSDAFYPGGDSSDSTTDEHHGIPAGKFHIDLPTLLEDKYLSIDIGRFGRLIDIRINGFTHVSVSDGIAKDGVVHGLSSVLIPPKKVGGELVHWNGQGEISVEELMERLQGFVEDGEAENLDL